MHGNVQMVERYDKSKMPSMKEKRPSERGGHSGGTDEASDIHEIKQVVADHGPAEKTVIEHGHEKGEHHVHSYHEDGHHHHSVHGSPAEAHAAAAHLGGVEDGNELHEAHDGMQEQDTLAEAGHRSGIEHSKHRPISGGGFLPEHEADFGD